MLLAMTVRSFFCSNTVQVLTFQEQSILNHTNQLFLGLRRLIVVRHAKKHFFQMQYQMPIDALDKHLYSKQQDLIRILTKVALYQWYY
jgi:hypothetical protein